MAYSMQQQQQQQQQRWGWGWWGMVQYCCCLGVVFLCSSLQHLSSIRHLGLSISLSQSIMTERRLAHDCVVSVSEYMLVSPLFKMAVAFIFWSHMVRPYRTEDTFFSYVRYGRNYRLWVPDRIPLTQRKKNLTIQWCMHVIIKTFHSLDLGKKV